jgi:hypothetical protein
MSGDDLVEGRAASCGRGGGAAALDDGGDPIPASQVSGTATEDVAAAAWLVIVGCLSAPCGHQQ